MCEAINPWMNRSLRERGSALADVGVASGNGLLINRRAAVAVGLFDERYFMGKDDGDFTHRMRIGGYRILELPRRWCCTAAGRGATGSSTTRFGTGGISCSRTTNGALMHPAVPGGPRAPATDRSPRQRIRGHVLESGPRLIAMLPDLSRDRAAVRHFRKLNDGALLKSDRLIVRDDLMTPLTRVGKSLYDAWLSAYWSLLRHTVLADDARRSHPHALLLPDYRGVESNAERLARYLWRTAYACRCSRSASVSSCRTKLTRRITIRRIGPRGERSSFWQMADERHRSLLVRHSAITTSSAAWTIVRRASPRWWRVG